MTHDLQQQESGAIPTGEAATGRLRLALLLLALTFVAYARVVHCGWIWDDKFNVWKNPMIASPWGLRVIWLDLHANLQYYPLTSSSFWLEHKLWGFRPAPYHLTNVLLHGVNAVLVWTILKHLRVRGAYLAAVLFAVHPVHVESVAWVTERKNLLSGTLCLGSALVFLRRALPATTAQASERWLYKLSLALFVLALLSKTAVAPLPAVLLVVLIWRCGWPPTRRDILALLPMFAAAVLLGWVTASLERHHVGATGAEFNFTLLQRLLLAGRAFWMYVLKLLWPHPLMFFYPRWPLDTHQWTGFFWPAAIALALVAFWAARRRLGGGPLVAMLVFAGFLFPALGFFNVFVFRYTFVCDHFQYLASIGLLALIAAAATAYVPSKPLAAMATCAVIVLIVLVWRQVPIYQNDAALWRDTIAKNPNTWAAHNNLGTALIDVGDSAQAVPLLLRAAELNPHNPWPPANLAVAMQALGRPSESLDWAKKALQIDPNHARLFGILGSVYLGLGQYEEALTAYRKAIQIDHRTTFALAGLARLLATCPYGSVRDPQAAVETAEKAYRMTGTSDLDVLEALMIAYREAGRRDDAVKVARDGVRAAELQQNQPRADYFREKLNEMGGSGGPS